jgi:hypothetical protein
MTWEFSVLEVVVETAHEALGGTSSLQRKEMLVLLLVYALTRHASSLSGTRVAQEEAELRPLLTFCSRRSMHFLGEKLSGVKVFTLQVPVVLGW